MFFQIGEEEWHLIGLSFIFFCCGMIYISWDFFIVFYKCFSSLLYSVDRGETNIVSLGVLEVLPCNIGFWTAKVASINDNRL